MRRDDGMKKTIKEGKEGGEDMIKFTKIEESRGSGEEH